MDYREIVAVTGIGGLFQLLTTKSDGAIVRNLADKTTKFISARLHNVTPLESIEIYTTGANVRLHEVLELIKNNEASHPPVDHKKADNESIKSYLKGIFPDLDDERVYVSDMKKILRWYEILKANDLLNFDFYNKEEEEEVKEEDSSESPAPAAAKKAKEETEEAEEKKTAKKAVKKKSAPKKEAGESSPKKAAPKKAAKKKSEE